MADPNDRKTNPTGLAPNGCRKPKPEGAEHVRCRACNRPLKTEASITAGIGPTCAKKIGADNLEPSPRYKGRKISVDPNQLYLPYDLRPHPKPQLEKSMKLEPQETAPAELEESNAKTESSAPRSMIVTVEVKTVCPDQHPSLIVVISEKGGGACSGC
jgi:hypothetical protein